MRRDSDFQERRNGHWAQPRAPGAWVASAWVPLFALFASACGRDAPATPIRASRDLLARGPDRVETPESEREHVDESERERVEPGVERAPGSPDLTASRVLLTPGSRLVWRVEVAGPTAAVHVSGVDPTAAVPVAGVAEGVLHVLAARTESPHGEPVAEPLELRLASAPGSTSTRTQASLDLAPLLAGRTESESTWIELALAWESPSGSTFALESVLLDEQRRELPSIVFVSIDTLAARHLSCYGYARATSPAIDRFASQAVLFEHCTANAAWTTPSYMSQLTGIEASAFWTELPRDAFGDEEWNGFLLADGYLTLAERLRAAGYRTAAFVDNPKIGGHLGFPQGFEVYDESAARISHKEPAGGIAHVVPRALEWLDALGDDEPFFLFVQAMDVHGPYLPEAPWSGKFRADGRDDPEHTAPVSYVIRGIWGAIPGYIAWPLFPEGQAPPRTATAPITAAYDEEIAGLDAEVGRFFDALRARGRWDASAVLVSADHGESMLDHQAFYNHHTVYQEVVHVPLVLRLPDGRAAGRRVSDRVRLLDLYPTLVELAGLSNEGVLLHGRSLVPLLEGRSLSAAPALSVGGMFDQASIELGGWKLVETIPSVRSGQESLLSSPWARAWLEQRFPELAGRIAGAHPRREFFVAFQRAGLDVDQVIDELLADIGKPWYELYYLPDDPREERDLSAEHPERVAQLSALLDERRARAIAAHLEPGQVARPRARTADELRELSELGYVDEE